MFLDRLKLVSPERASHIAGVDKSVIAKAIKLYRDTHGARGLAFVIFSGRTRPLVRLSAIDDWLSRLEEDSRYA